ncbi:MAG: hypothetical protein AB7U07_20340 [Thermoleophilia bacterium]
MIAELTALADQARGLSHRLASASRDPPPPRDDADVVAWERRVRKALAGDPARRAAFDAGRRRPGPLEAAVGPWEPGRRRLARGQDSVNGLLGALRLGMPGEVHPDRRASLYALVHDGRRLRLRLWLCDAVRADDEVAIWEIKVRNALAKDRAALAAFDRDPPGGFPDHLGTGPKRLAFRRRSLDALLRV